MNAAPFDSAKHPAGDLKVQNGLPRPDFYVFLRSSLNAAPFNGKRTALLRGLKVQNGLPWP